MKLLHSPTSLAPAPSLQVIRELLGTEGEGHQQRYVIVVEHDLSVLDYLSDFICCLYGKPGAYGVVTLPFSVREGINIFLAGAALGGEQAGAGVRCVLWGHCACLGRITCAGAVGSRAWMGVMAVQQACHYWLLPCMLRVLPTASSRWHWTCSTAYHSTAPHRLALCCVRAGFVPTENLRFREESLTFKVAEQDTKEEEVKKFLRYQYPAMRKTQGNFTMNVEEGEFTDSEIIVMLGENGTGKTTFIRMLAGMLAPDEVRGAAAAAAGGSCNDAAEDKAVHSNANVCCYFRFDSC
jgi:hypothetical protein